MVLSGQIWPAWGLLVTLVHGTRVHFELDLTWRVGAPNGQEREMIFINGQFPGPPMVLNQGDDVTVTVINHLPFNTSVHFHGIEYEKYPLYYFLLGKKRIYIDNRVFLFLDRKTRRGRMEYLALLNGPYHLRICSPINGMPTNMAPIGIIPMTWLPCKMASTARFIYGKHVPQKSTLQIDIMLSSPDRI